MQTLSNISFLWLVLIAILALAIALWFYRKKKGWLSEISNRLRISLLSLRFLSLFFIGVLLLGLLFQSIATHEQKPILVVGIDNSSSMLNYKDSSEVKKNTQQLIGQIQKQLGDKFTIEMQTVSVSSSASLAVDSFDFKGKFTNLYGGLNAVLENYYNQNLGALVLLSDGNYTSGKNPVYVADKFKDVPIYGIGVGDTIQKYDQQIKGVAVNQVAFLGNDFPVEVYVEGNKIPKGKVQISILHNERTIATKNVQYAGEEREFHTVNFELPAESVGFQTYSVKVATLDKESNIQNNSKPFYIEIIDTRSRVLLVGSGSHPDISAIKSVLEEDKNLEVEVVDIAKWDKNITDVELVVYHSPSNRIKAPIHQKLTEGKHAVLYIIGSQTDKRVVDALNIGLRIPNALQTDEIQSSVNKGFGLFTVENELAERIEQFPPLVCPFGRMQEAGHDVLTYQRVGQVIKKEPQIFFGKQGRKKYGVVYGDGLWKWKLMEYAKHGNHDGFNKIIQKIQQYLIVKQNTSPFRLQLPKRFSEGESIELHAQYLNASLKPVTSAEIDFQLEDANGNERKLQFGVNQSQYKLNLGELDAGVYKWHSTATFKGEKSTKNGEFLVESNSIEQQFTKANHTILYQLSKQTGGELSLLNASSTKWMQDLNQREDITTVAYEESTFHGLVDELVLLLIILLLLGAEWFLRRVNGAY